MWIHSIFGGGDNAPRCFRHKLSCHLYADSKKELDAFALKLGLKLSWFQNHPMLKHYDLTEGKRILAVKLGAIQQNRKEAINKWRELRTVIIEKSVPADVSSEAGLPVSQVPPPVISE